MSQLNRMCLMAALFSVVAVGANAVPGPDRVELRKRQVVRAALDSQGHAQLDPVFLKAVARADALLDIELGTSRETALVSLRSTGRPVCETFALDEGRKLVVDLYNTINFHSGKRLTPENQSIIRQVRTSLFALDPQFISRVVIDLAIPCVFEMAQNDDQITIDLSAANRPCLTQPTLADAIEKTAEDMACRKARVQIALACLEEVGQRAQDALEVQEEVLQHSETRLLEAQRAMGGPNGEHDRATLVSEVLQDELSNIEEAQGVFHCLVTEQERVQQDIRNRCRQHGATMMRRIASLEAALNALRCEVGSNKTNETEAWATLRTHQEGLERAERVDSQVLEVLKAEQNAQGKALREGFNALDLMMLAAEGDETVEMLRSHLAENQSAPKLATSRQESPDDAKGNVDAVISRLNKEIGLLRHQPQSKQPKRLVETAPVRAPEAGSNLEPIDFGALVEVSDAAREMCAAAVGKAYAAARWADTGFREAAQGLAAELQRVHLAREMSDEPLEADTAAPVAPTRQPVLKITARPAMMERRIAKLATELEAVKAAKPDLRNDLVAPLAFYAEGNALDVPTLPEGPPPAPPGKRAVGQRSSAADTWQIVPQVTAQEVPRTYRLEPAIGAPVPENDAGPAQVSLLMAEGDPLEQPVDIDFRDMDLSHMVGLLAEMAHINVVASVDLTGLVTARLTNMPLRQAMEIVLRLKGLGMIEEDGVYRITGYDDVMAAQQVRRFVYLEHTNAEEIKTTLADIIVGMPESEQIIISTVGANLVILCGPEQALLELEEIVRQLDVEEPVLPTVTEAIKLNYADPTELLQTLQGGVMGALPASPGQSGAGGRGPTAGDEGRHMAADTRGRHIIVTDTPVRVEQIRGLIKDLDLPVKQVNIDAMIVDALLTNVAETGVDWILNAVRRTNTRGEIVGNLQQLLMEADVTRVSPGAVGMAPSAGQLSLAILSGDIDIRGLISAQVESSKARLLANPVISTVENQKATITISEEQPYDEKTQSVTGPPMTSTAFKDIGTVLEVTPRVTHDDHILVEVNAKQSSFRGYARNDVPIEIKREAQTTLRTDNGQTVFIGGLRRFDTIADVSKVPVLGDVPVLNFLFRHNKRDERCTELLIFLTCNVIPDKIPDLTPKMQAEHDRLKHVPEVPDAEGNLFRSILHPKDERDPIWRRSR